MHSISSLETNPRAVLAAVFRATSRIISVINDNENENVKKLIHACCSMKYFGAFGGDQDSKINSKNLMCISSPREFHLVPTYDATNECYYFGEKTYGSKNEQVPEFLRLPDSKSLEFLNSV